MTNTQEVALTGDLVIDAITNGYRWSIEGGDALNFSVSNGFNGEAWVHPEDVAIRLATALSMYSYYADIRFHFLGNYSTPHEAVISNSNINLSIGSIGDIFENAHQWAIGLPPNSAFNEFYLGAPGDIFINVDSEAVLLPSYEIGSQGWFLLLHELGHALGLKHPHDDGGTGRPTFSNIGIGGLDIDWATVMSYNDDASWNPFSWDPATPMVLDALGLMYLYGKNSSTNSGDTQFSLAATKNTYSTTWDASGLDVLDASGASEGWSIFLPSITLSSMVDEKVGYATPLSQIHSAIPTTLQWFIGDYEQAVGSGYADEIEGNAQNNQIFALAGQDRIAGASGDDLIDGGAGIDTAVFLGSREQYQLTSLQSIDQLIQVRDLVADRDGADSLYAIERLAFSDVMLALDVRVDQHAGNSYLLYQAAFDRNPDEIGLGYWIAQLDNGFDIIKDVALNFILSEEFSMSYGENPSQSEFINLLYQNIFDRSADFEGLDYWSAELMREGDTLLARASVLNNFAISAEYLDDVAGQILSGIIYQAYIA